MIELILSYLKYWKTAAVLVLALGCVVSFHLAKTRGEKLKETTQTLETERRHFQNKLIEIEKAVQDERERQNFKTRQGKKIKLAGEALRFDPDLRDAYELLRTRLAGHGAR